MADSQSAATNTPLGANPARGPLADITVLDLTRALAGPHAAQMLGDQGARVIKVETPGRGDDTRGWGPPFVGPHEDISTYFLSCNRNKESIALDLKDAEDAALLESMIQRADVLMENFRTGAMDRLGFSTTRLMELNPRLIVLNISGFGHDGPEGGRAGYDQIAQGEAGLMSITGSGPQDPQRVGVPIADLLAGIHGAYGVMTALYERERTGRGQVVRTSLLAAVTGVHAFQGTRWTVAAGVPAAQGNHHPAITPYGLFHCGDGTIQIAAGNEALWSKLCTELDLDAKAPGMATNAERNANRERVIQTVEAALAPHRAEDLLSRFAAAGIPAGKVRTMDEVYTWEQTRSQGLLAQVEHPVLGEVTLPGPPLRFFDVDGDGERETTHRQFGSPPMLDADADAVRAWANGVREEA